MRSKKYFLSTILSVVIFPGIVSAQYPRTMGLIFRDSAANSPGYTLFAPMNYNVTYLIDNAGMLVHFWEGIYNPGSSVNLCENGLLLRTCYIGNQVFYGGGAGGRVELVDWDGDVVWAYNYSSAIVCQHHDAIMLPNGNILMIAWEYKTRAEAIAAGRDANQLISNSLWPDHLVEVDPDNDSIVWEWHVWDHLIQDYDSTKSNYGNPADHPELIDLNFVAGMAVADWNHSNTVAYNPELDQVMISSRQFSEIWIIDHSTTKEEAKRHSGGRYGKGGDLLYRWGNPRVYRREGIVGQTLFGQHDAQWIDTGLPGAGHILVFNNGYGRTPTFSTVDELVPPMDSAGFYYLGSDSAYGPAGPLWQFIADPPESLYSSLISGCQRLPNGNTLICNGLNGTFLEVTSEGRVVWKYINPVTRYGPQYQGSTILPGANQVFRVRRYHPDYPGLRGRQLNSLGPIERYPQAVFDGQGSVGSQEFWRPTIVRGSIFVVGSEFADLVDPSGKRRARLIAGRNDIRGLPAGVYFLVSPSYPRGKRVIVAR